MDVWLITTIPGLLTISVIGTIIASVAIYLLKQLYGWIKRTLPPAAKRFFTRIGHGILNVLSRRSMKYFQKLDEAEQRGRLVPYYVVMVMRFILHLVVAVIAFNLAATTASVLQVVEELPRRPEWTMFLVIFAITFMYSTLQAIKTYFWTSLTYRTSETEVKGWLVKAREDGEIEDGRGYRQ